MNDYIANSSDIEKWIGSKCHYTDEKELCDFYVQMNWDCGNNHSRIIWEWLRNSPCFEEFQIDKFRMWKENGQVVCAVRTMSPWGEAVIDNRCSTEEILYDVILYVEENLSIKQENDKPQILIYHTHSQETYCDSTPGKASDTVVGVGSYLTKILEDEYGYNVIHDKTTYDIVDGKENRNIAYNQAEKGLEKILEKNPTIEVLIDIHRDSGAARTI
jgi:hypothetical protein